MTFSKLTWHKRTHGHEFTGAEFRVLMSIFDHSDEHGRNSHPGLKLLMAETGYGKTAVSEALTALKARGWITQARKGSGTSGKTSVYELVPNAPSSNAGAVQPDAEGRSVVADQLPEVGPVERTSWSAGADTVVPLERTPTDPDIRSGSDPSRSDQEEVRYSPNHLEDQDEAGHASRPLAVEGRTEHYRTSCDGRGHDGPSNEAASTPAAETEGAREAPEGLVGLRPPTATGSPFDDPFASVPAWRVESAAGEARAARYLEPATAGGPPASPWD